MSTQKKTQKKTHRQFTPEQKLRILKYFDEHEQNTPLTLARYNIGRSSLSRWRKDHWDEYLAEKEKNIKSLAQVEPEQKSISNNTPNNIEDTEIRNRAFELTSDIFDLIQFKIRRDTMLMVNDESKVGSIKLAELTKYIEITLPYFLPKVESVSDKEEEAGILTKKYSKISLIIQQQANNIYNGEEKNTNIRSKPGITFGKLDEHGNANPKPSAQEWSMEAGTGED